MFSITPENTPHQDHQGQQCNLAITERKLTFLQTESKVVFAAILSFLSLSGCIAIVILYPNNCGLCNACFTIIGSVMGSWGTCLLSKTNQCLKPHCS